MLCELSSQSVFICDLIFYEALFSFKEDGAKEKSFLSDFREQLFLRILIREVTKGPATVMQKL